jgi:hypothetical protein
MNLTALIAVLIPKLPQVAFTPSSVLLVVYLSIITASPPARSLYA